MFSSVIKPTLALIIISVCVAGLLAATYNLAGIADLGGGLSPDDLENYRPQVMPGASKLVLAAVDTETEGLLGVYKDESGTGLAIHVQTKGYSSKDPLVLLVGIDNAGVITGVAVTANSETPGLGSKATEPGYLAQYTGKSGELTAGTDIDVIAGSTVSSEAVVTGVNFALSCYETVKGEVE